MVLLALSVEGTREPDANGAAGSCPNIPSDNNYSVSLTYRVAGPVSLAQQVKLPVALVDQHAVGQHLFGQHLVGLFHFMGLRRAGGEPKT